jgi:hypothetical protein
VAARIALKKRKATNSHSKRNKSGTTIAKTGKRTTTHGKTKRKHKQHGKSVHRPREWARIGATATSQQMRVLSRRVEIYYPRIGWMRGKDCWTDISAGGISINTTHRGFERWWLRRKTKNSTTYARVSDRTHLLYVGLYKIRFLWPPALLHARESLRRANGTWIVKVPAHLI